MNTHFSMVVMKKLVLIMLIFSTSTVVNAQNYPDRFLNGHTKLIQSEELGREHRIFIYLPEEYGESAVSYPVHYLTDAPGTSNLFFDLLRLHNLGNTMPQGIVVGLSSDNREANLHPEKGAEQYLGFLEKEVIPFIDGNYRTESFRSIAGHSLGGGFALYAFLSRLDLFNACIAGSPYPLEYITEMIRNISIQNKITEYRFLYSSTGTVEDIQQPHFESFQSAIARESIENLEYYFQINEGENHLSNLAVNFQDGLESLYSDWKFVLPDKLYQPADVLLSKHYKHLSEKVGYSVTISEWDVIYPLMDQLAKRDDFRNAINLLNYSLELYPNSDQTYAFLARAYVSIGKKDSARINLEKALSINPNNEFALHIQELLNK